VSNAENEEPWMNTWELPVDKNTLSIPTAAKIEGGS
jgi:hypothetical protein